MALRWTWDGNVFFGVNRQDRRFRDITAWESQNRGMLPFDATRLTASLSHEGQVGARPLAATIAFAENRQFKGHNDNTDAYLAEAVAGLTRRAPEYLDDLRCYFSVTGTIWMMVGNLAGVPPGFGFG